MTVWVEIHCDVRSEMPDPERPPGENTCWGNLNAHPMAGALNVDDAYGIALEVARHKGWTRRKLASLDGHVGWVCPHCQKFWPE